MTEPALLAELRARDIQVWADGDQLQCDAPAGMLTPELRERLRQRKNEILDYLRGPAELSFSQQRLWFLDQVDPGGAAYFIAQALELRGTLDVLLLERALGALVSRHSSLRTVFVNVEGRPLQVVSEPESWTLPVKDLSGAADKDQRLGKLLREEASRGFDLARGPLFRARLYRLAADTHVLLLTMHHIITDGWSINILIRELGEAYGRFSRGEAATLPEIPVQYRDFARWQRSSLQGEALDAQISHWRSRLEGAPQVIDLPADRPRPFVESHRGAIHSFTLPLELTDALRNLSRREGATLFMTLLSGFTLLLSRYSGQRDLLIGTPVANRNRTEFEDVVGFFANTLVLRADLSGELSVRQYLARMGEVCLDAVAHQDLPFDRLVEELQPQRDLSRNPLFQVMFALQNEPLRALELQGLTLSPFEVDAGGAQFDLTLIMQETVEGLRANFNYATDLFDESTIARMGTHLRSLLEAMTDTPERSVWDLPLLMEAERHQLVVGWNDTRADYPADALIHELFEAQAKRAPHAVAVEYEGRQLTYEELNTRANQVAHYLARQGVGPDVMVGICVERSLDMVVGILGILKAGGAYVPLDPDYPASRLSFMLDDTAAPLLLTQMRLRNRLSGYRGRTLSLDADWPEIAREREDDPKVRVSARNLAYVIYTSGSTGRPKGTCIEHRSVVRLVKSTNYVELGSQEVFLQFAPLSFDASTFELWGSLLNGAKLVVCPAGALSLKELARVIQERGVTTLWLTTALFHQMVDEQIESLRGVRQLLAGGETLSVSHARRMLEVIGKGRLINCYGPTENTTFTCCHVMTTDSRIELTVPIGRPIGNTRVYVLDGHMRPVPVGVYGELYIGGDGLAREYLHQPELTAEKFVSDPFSSEVGARLYRSGDLVRFRADGCIEFLGRIDNQVKIRGYRIEPDEINAVLNTYPGVRGSHVLARRRKSGELSLCAYYVPDPTAGTIPTDSELKSFLREHLPNYMIPGSLIRVETIPLTPNGKVDQQGLPDPESNAIERDREFVAPRDETERVLCRIWAETLKLEQVGIDDDFFAIGGHSLLAAKLFARLDEQFGRSLPLGTLFSAPTVRALAERYQAVPEQQFRALVALRKSGSLTPVFAVPGVFGNVVGFAELAQALGPDQPFYGLQSVGLDGSEASLTSIEEMAKLNISELLTVQPQGPYAIIGACFGATVAYEMARQLLAEGIDIAYLGLLDPTQREGRDLRDSPASTPRTLRRAAALSNLVSGRLRLYLEEMNQLNGKDRINFVAQKLRFLGASVKQSKRLGGVRRELNQIEVYRSNLHALDRYQRKPLNGKLKFLEIFETSRCNRAATNEPIDWAAFWKDSVTRHLVPGKDSGDMLSGKNVRALAALLVERLQAAFGKDSIALVPSLKSAQSG
jgi:amino acid adenylation domain-containing protein